ncbi:Transposable element Tcb1 transposase [Araneus ventricosus]|uniref:Transposable element Tcb1 transposase n=1 Tax=Araneus ventricosus TaxID=182803 RepID=A0A4Y2IYH0_ARAVE|nr:Transposable element Tcb1 transposase [Araneus ventricosus]
MSGHCVPTLHRKKRLCEEHKTTCYFDCFRKDAGISLEKNSSLSLSFTYTDPGGPYQLFFMGPTCHRASWQPGQSATEGRRRKENDFSAHNLRRLQADGLNGRRLVKKPMISTKDRKARVEWAKVHKDWTKKEWEDVFWSDESKYTLFGTDGIQSISCPTALVSTPSTRFQQ